MIIVTFSCVQQINRASRGDLTPDELKERQVCFLFTVLVPVLYHSLRYGPKRIFFCIFCHYLIVS